MDNAIIGTPDQPMALGSATDTPKVVKEGNADMTVGIMTAGGVWNVIKNGSYHVEQTFGNAVLPSCPTVITDVPWACQAMVDMMIGILG